MAISKSKPAKVRSAYVCGECGASYSQWQRQCGDCGAWSSLAEIVLSSATVKQTRAGYAGIDAAQVTALKKVSGEKQQRLSTGLNELDRVLGGRAARAGDLGDVSDRGAITETLPYAG